jgi:sialate O-acetylesterase
MEWTLGPRVGNGVEGWEEAARTSADPELRLFDVENALAPAPSADLKGSWQVAGPESARVFSACAYFFARKLRAELAVPVGVISADWGGTPAEAWTRAEALGEFPEFAEALAAEAAFVREPEKAEARYGADSQRYWQHALELDAAHGLADAARERCDESGWGTVELPVPWEKHGLADFDGLAWYRRTLELPADWAGQELVVSLGAIDDRDTVYWNGTRIGGHEDDGQWQTPRVYTLPAGLAHAGANTLAVRVLDTGGLGGFAGAPAELKLSRAGAAAPLSLAGTWRWKAGTPLAELGAPPLKEAFGPGSPSVLWNAMVAPLTPCALRGVIWYQGEANIAQAERYRALFPALIGSWRAAFGHGDFRSTSCRSRPTATRATAARPRACATRSGAPWRSPTPAWP